MPALATRNAEAGAPDTSCGGPGAALAVAASATAALCGQATAGASAPRPPPRRPGPLPLRALNHVSLCVRDVAKSASFYADVLGFVEVRRPACFDFDGSW
jgi:hypothetical protein